jgi:ADP-heptose:LPS heptosyltransferase
VERPCAIRHPDPAATAGACRLCHLYQTRADYRALWGGDPTGVRPPGAAARVWHCPNRQVWNWSVTSGGKVIDSGSEPTREAAEAEVAAVGLESPADTVVLNMGAGGIGDGLLGLLASAGLKADHPAAHVTYRVGPRALPFVRLFHGYDALREHDPDGRQHPTADRQMNGGYGLELRTRSAEPRWERYRRMAGASRAVRPALRDAERVRAAGADYAGAVLLCPFSADTIREYAVVGWVALEAALRAAGRRPVVVHGGDGRADVLRSEKLLGAAPERVAGAMLNAACVVGGDSGMAHLAGLLGVPTIVLSGPSDGTRIFGAYPRVVNLAGPLPCNGCWWQPRAGYQAAQCQPHCPSIQGITAARILDAIGGLADG